MLLQILSRGTFSILFFLHFLHGLTIEVSSREENKQVDLTTRLMKKCFPSVKASYLITDSYKNFLYADFYSNMVGAITLFEKSENFSINEMRKKVPTSSIIMALSSSSKMEEALANAKWRNFRQFFVILDGGDSANGCDNAQAFLMEAWKNSVLKAVFLCWNNQKRVSQFLTFNPFNSYAPKFWEKISVVSGINGHPWTLFSRNYGTDVATCKSLFFGRTSNLGGYSIKFGVFHLPPFLSYKKLDGVDTFEGYDYKIMKLLAKELNATLVTDGISRILGRFDNTTSRGLLWRVATGEVDMTMNSLILRAVSRSAEITYPFHSAGLSAITQQRLSHEHGGQLFSFLPPSIVVLLLLICVLVFFLLVYLFKDPYSRNIIDTVPLCLNLPLPSMPISTSGRIIFAATLLGITIANTIIQAKMDTVMSVQNTAMNVEKIEDLNDLNYTVLTRRGILSQTLEVNGVRNIRHVPEYLNCSALKIHEAFVGVEYILRTLLSDDCHISRHPIVPGLFVSYYTRKNWPIYPKVNKKLLMLFEGDLTQYISEMILRKYHKPSHQEVDDYQEITMRHMEYAFYIFIISSLVSLVVFFMELIVARA